MLWFLLACDLGDAAAVGHRVEAIDVTLDEQGRPVRYALDRDGNGQVERVTTFTYDGPRMVEVAWRDGHSAPVRKVAVWQGDQVTFDGMVWTLRDGRPARLVLAGGRQRSFEWHDGLLASIDHGGSRRVYDVVDDQRVAWRGQGVGLCTFDEQGRLVAREIDVSGVGRAGAVSRSQWEHGPHGWVRERTVTSDRSWMTERTWRDGGVDEVETVGEIESVRRVWTVSGGLLEGVWMDWLLDHQHGPLREPVDCQGLRRARHQWLP